jgi:uncharacterized membrane protein
MGGLSAACLGVAAGSSVFLAAALGGIGGVIGAFAGYELRRRLVRGLKVKDVVIAVLEDLVAIGLAYLIVSPQ